MPSANHATHDTASAVLESNSNSFDEQHAAILHEDSPPAASFKQSAMKEKSAEESNSDFIDEQQAVVWVEDEKPLAEKLSGAQPQNCTAVAQLTKDTAKGPSDVLDHLEQKCVGTLD